MLDVMQLRPPMIHQVFITTTPPKTNMEHENNPRKEQDKDPQTTNLCSMSNLAGVMGDYILPWVDLVFLKAPKATLTNSPKPCDHGRQMSSFSDTQQSCLVQKTGGVATLQMKMYFTGWCDR